MKIKREREEPCYICGHYHDYEGGEPCSICGHRLSTSEERVPVTSAFPSEIVQDFLFLGSYDNASRAELLKALGIRYILNCVPTCQVLYKNSFTYHTVSSVPPPLNECIEFIETARRENSKILVHCMSGISRSPAVVAAYLMKSRSWRLVDSMKWVKERQPSMQLTPGVLPPSCPAQSPFARPPALSVVLHGPTAVLNIPPTPIVDTVTSPRC